MVSGEEKYKAGAVVFDKVHNTSGVVRAMVPEPEDQHHQTFYVVMLDCRCGKRYGTGVTKESHQPTCPKQFREVHLVTSQMEEE